MSDDDPFAEPDDTDRTVIRPNPGGRRPAAAPVPNPAAQPAPMAPQSGTSSYDDPAGFGQQPVAPTPAPAPAAQPASADKSVASSLTGMNPLNSAATTLFSLVSRIRNRAQHPDPEAMRRSVVAEVRSFESRALQSKVDAQAVKVARYAICATLDDVVLNTPWGGSSQWAQQSMVGTFHRETVGGDRFYDLLARLEQDPAQNIDVLEFLYMCLSLGFEGRLRVEQGGSDKHMNIRMGLARIIRTQRGEMEKELSPHWVGLDVPHRILSAWKPFWISVGAVAGVLTLSFVGLSYALTSQTQNVIGQLSALNPGGIATLERRAPPVVAKTPIKSSQPELVAGFLKKEIEEGLVTIFEDTNTITVRIAGNGMFGSASDALKPDFKTPLARVASALNATSGPVIIAGHSDSSPINSARFKSNQALSLARAESVRKSVASNMKDPSRLQAEGRSDKEPIASNKTRAGRATNRRIEIILMREDLE
jgi:type VI secretion system protein ImpK